MIAQVEAMPQNQSGADKSGRWLGSYADHKALFDAFTPAPRKVTHPLAPLAGELAGHSVRYVLIGVSGKERREFMIEGVPVPTARLLHVIESKRGAGRPKDQLFLAMYQDALEQLLKRAT